MYFIYLYIILKYSIMWTSLVRDHPIQWYTYVKNGYVKMFYCVSLLYNASSNMQVKLFSMQTIKVSSTESGIISVVYILERSISKNMQ